MRRLGISSEMRKPIQLVNSASPEPVRQSVRPIKHVVLIIQENDTFAKPSK
jgi:phospholipase C